MMHDPVKPPKPYDLDEIKVECVNLTASLPRYRFESFLAGHEGTRPSHQPAWMRAIDYAFDHRPYAIQCTKGDRIIGVLSVHRVVSRRFGSALVSTAFGVDGGILVYEDEAIPHLTEAVIALARRLDCPRIELRGGVVPEGWATDSETYVGFRGVLEKTPEAQLKAIPRKQRAEVRKSLEMGFKVEVGRTRQLFDEHYDVYSQSVRNLGTPVFGKRLFKAMLEAFPRAEIMVVKHNDIPVA